MMGLSMMGSSVQVKGGIYMQVNMRLLVVINSKFEAKWILEQSE